MEGVFTLCIYNFNFSPSLFDEGLDFMRMEDITGSQQLDLLAVLLNVDILEAVAVCCILPFFSAE